MGTEVITWEEALERTTSTDETKTLITEAIDTVSYSTHPRGVVKVDQYAGGVNVTLGYCYDNDTRLNHIATIVLTAGFAVEVYDVDGRRHSRISVKRLMQRATLNGGWEWS